MKDKRLALRDTQRVYDTLLTFQRKKKPSGPFDPPDEYEDVLSLWAESRYLRGRNFYAARSANIKTDVEFIIRWNNEIDENMRLLVNGRTFNIEGILPLDNDRLFMSIKAYEIKHDV